MGCKWEWPTNSSKINQDSSKAHTALDIGLAVGDPIFAAFAGTIKAVVNSATGYGKHVVLDTDDGKEIIYGHLDGFNVSQGQRVKKGQTIGYGGSTGNSTGPHVHFEVRENGKPIDPWGCLSASSGSTTQGTPRKSGNPLAPNTSDDPESWLAMLTGIDIDVVNVIGIVIGIALVLMGVWFLYTSPQAKDIRDRIDITLDTTKKAAETVAEPVGKALGAAAMVAV